MSGKARVTVTLVQETLAALDRAVGERRFASRSGAIEAALAAWVQLEHRRRRDAEIDAYYDAQSPSDQAEERAWAQLGGGRLVRDAGPQRKLGPGSRPGAFSTNT